MDTALTCIRCPSAAFLDPKKEVCYKTCGLFCKKLKAIVGKYETCRLKGPGGKRSAVRRGRAGS